MSNERRVEYSTLKLELDEKTEYRDHKKNRYNGYIKSIRVGRSSSPNNIFKIRLKEGDEITLWPGRIINFAERSEGATFSWEAQTQEWAEIEFSENSFFVGGDNQSGASSTSGVGSIFRKNEYELDTLSVVQIASVNQKRVSMRIENLGSTMIYIGDQLLVDPSIASDLRRKNTIRLQPFSFIELNITGELWANVHSKVGDGVNKTLSVEVLEVLK